MKPTVSKHFDSGGAIGDGLGQQYDPNSWFQGFRFSVCHVFAPTYVTRLSFHSSRPASVFSHAPKDPSSIAYSRCMGLTTPPSSGF